MHKSIRFAAKGLATLAVAVGLATAGQGAAYADTEVTVPGCYGAGPAIYCDITVQVLSAPTPALGSYTTEVCTGTCRDVTLPWVELQPGSPGELRACLRTADRGGYTTQTCYPIGGGSIVDDVDALVDWAVYEVQTLKDQICPGSLKDCLATVRAYVDQAVADLIRTINEICYNLGCQNISLS